MSHFFKSAPHALGLMTQQIHLPFIVPAKMYKKMKETMIRLSTLTLEEGLLYLKNQPSRKIGGYWVENVAKASATRLKMFSSGQTTCVSCGLKGTHFHIERHKNDKVMPFSVNLYGYKGDREVMLTWDHIIPRSLGGSNRLENAQCMCSDCNSQKGNILTLPELVAAATHPNPLVVFKLPEPTPRARISSIIAEAKRDFELLRKE